jgi:hypothetical protein
MLCKGWCMSPMTWITSLRKKALRGYSSPLSGCDGSQLLIELISSLKFRELSLRTFLAISIAWCEFVINCGIALLSSRRTGLSVKWREFQFLETYLRSSIQQAEVTKSFAYLSPYRVSMSDTNFNKASISSFTDGSRYCSAIYAVSICPLHHHS